MVVVVGEGGRSPFWIVCFFSCDLHGLILPDKMALSVAAQLCVFDQKWTIIGLKDSVLLCDLKGPHSIG